MFYSREREPREPQPRNLLNIVSNVAPSGRDLRATEGRLGSVLTEYSNRLRAVSKRRDPLIFADLLTPGYAGVQEFALLVQKQNYQLQEFKKGEDDSVLRLLFRKTVDSAIAEADTALQRLKDSAVNEETREQWGKRKATLSSILDELPEPPKN